ncbi:MAG: glycosyltransferase family 4 protein [Candidatus Heimdallarchaeota archaeon]
MPERPSIAFANPQLARPSIFPPHSGYAQRLFWLAKHSSELGARVRIFSIGKKRTSSCFHDGVFETVVKGFRIKKPERGIMRLVDYVGYPLFGMPFSQKVFDMNKHISAYFEAFSADIIDCNFGMPMVSACAKAADKLDIPLVVTFHNVWTLLYMRAFRILTNKLPFSFSANHLSKPAAKREVGITKLADQTICVSENDRRMLVKMGAPAEKISVIPNGVVSNAYEHINEQLIRETRKFLGISPSDSVVVFLGSRGWFPNELAFKDILQKIGPELKQKSPQTRILVIGRGHIPKKLGNIQIIGEVPDIRPYIALADVAICPLTMGGGTKLKILEYFAASKPVITSSYGIEGFSSLDSKKDVILEEEISEFPNQVANLLEDSALKEALGNNGRKIAFKYDWKEISGQYMQIIQRMCGKK